MIALFDSILTLMLGVCSVACYDVYVILATVLYIGKIFICEWEVF